MLASSYLQFLRRATEMTCYLLAFGSELSEGVISVLALLVLLYILYNIHKPLVFRRSHKSQDSQGALTRSGKVLS